MQKNGNKTSLILSTNFRRFLQFPIALLPIIYTSSISLFYFHIINFQIVIDNKIIDNKKLPILLKTKQERKFFNTLFRFLLS